MCTLKLEKRKYQKCYSILPDNSVRELDCHFCEVIGLSANKIAINGQSDRKTYSWKRSMSYRRTA